MAPSKTESDPGGDCFGTPRAPGELCSATVLTDELDTPEAIALRGGVVYAATKAGLVRITEAGPERLVAGLERLGVSQVGIDGNWIAWISGRAVWRAALDDLGGAVEIGSHAAGGRIFEVKSGFVYFSTHDGGKGSIFRASLAEPKLIDVVMTNARTGYGAVGIDEKHLYAFGGDISSTVLRRTPIAGGEGESIATVDSGGLHLAISPDLAFVSTEGGILTTRKSGGAAARKVFDRGNVDSITSDADGVYFTVRADDAMRVYRSSLDGKTIRLLGQWYSKSFAIDIAVEGDALYVADYAGTVRKLPKR